MNKKQVDAKFNIGIRQIKEVGMTAGEKKRVLENILNSPSAADKPIRSPYGFYSFIFQLTKSRWVYAGSAFCLLVVLGGGVVFASSGTLPGNTLYPLKVKIVEPIHGAFIFSHEAKIEYQSSLATERLIEAEKLANEDKLDASKEEELNSLLKIHATAFNKAVDDFRKSGSASEGIEDDIIINFQARMNAHARVLEVIKGNQNSGQEAKDAGISKTARDNALKLKVIPKKRAEENPEKYQKRKDAVRSLIDKTASDLDRAPADASFRGKTIINDTHETLERARQLLRESEEGNGEEDHENDSSRLLDSESSAKEADIFLKAGLELK